MHTRLLVVFLALSAIPSARAQAPFRLEETTIDAVHAAIRARSLTCRRLVEASSMRPLSRTRFGGGVRYACPDCFKRVMALRKAVANARATK